MGKGRPQKYNHVSCHKKFMLRRLILLKKKSIKQASQQLGINYSTAKTIMFFHRKPFDTTPTYSSSLSTTIFENNGAKIVASVVHQISTKKIQIICSIGRGTWTSFHGYSHPTIPHFQIDNSNSQ